MKLRLTVAVKVTHMVLLLLASEDCCWLAVTHSLDSIACVLSKQLACSLKVHNCLREDVHDLQTALHRSQVYHTCSATLVVPMQSALILTLWHSNTQSRHLLQGWMLAHM